MARLTLLAFYGAVFVTFAALPVRDEPLDFSSVLSVELVPQILVRSRVTTVNQECFYFQQIVCEITHVFAGQVQLEHGRKFEATIMVAHPCTFAGPYPPIGPPAELGEVSIWCLYRDDDGQLRPLPPSSRYWRQKTNYWSGMPHLPARRGVEFDDRILPYRASTRQRSLVQSLRNWLSGPPSATATASTYRTAGSNYEEVEEWAAAVERVQRSRPQRQARVLQDYLRTTDNRFVAAWARHILELANK